ncbi:DDE superfamily endonuclease [Phytophthora infestans]|uniref:DDE superfamily endonuclease n=1 Tax=Phytophthora infestans TaxID=4787 RepID=A0A8S9V261_PHYIN|nr:DDE superfamily endonuclease [Phytophthora infestans]
MDSEEALLLLSGLVATVAALATCSREGSEHQQRRTVTVLHFEAMLEDAACEEWFSTNLRCSRASFLAIAEQLRLRGVLFAGCVAKQHSYEKKVATALYFFASPGGYREVSAAMGMNKSYVMDIVDEVCRVLYLSACDAVSFPRYHQGWEDLQAGFAARRGYPGVVGAVDGSLLAIDRPEDYDVTATSMFMSVEIRPGSWSDSKSWKHSIIGRRATSIIPAGTHFIGDSGYALLPHLMVSYAEHEEGGELNALQRRYNFLHSSTRMAVECTFGLWNERFRVLQTVMDEKTIMKTKRVVMATIVLHNWMLVLRDTTRITPYVESTEYEASEIDDHSASATMLRKIGKQKRDGIARIIC